MGFKSTELFALSEIDAKITFSLFSSSNKVFQLYENGSLLSVNTKSPFIKKLASVTAILSFVDN